jgi:uroporphyrinogen decarboxylase
LYLKAQIAAGVSAVQLFDTWCGELNLQDYSECVVPVMQEIVAGLGNAVPMIYYTKASHHLLPAIVRVGANVLSVDWRMPLAEVRKLAGPRVAIQGNLDPAILFASEDKIRTATLDIVSELAGHGHILNLGHGILQHTPVENAQLFIRTGQQAALQDWKSPVASR